MLPEPRVLDRGVTGDHVEQDAEAALVRRGDELVEVLERAELGVDRGVVRDVVAEVGERGGIDRREPEGVDAEPDQVVEPLDDPAQIADAVAVRVLERARVDLVDDRVLPPGHGRRGYAVAYQATGSRAVSPDPVAGPGPGPGPAEGRSDKIDRANEPRRSPARCPSSPERYATSQSPVTAQRAKHRSSRRCAAR